jgi:hypothetical protein
MMLMMMLLGCLTPTEIMMNMTHELSALQVFREECLHMANTPPPHDTTSSGDVECLPYITEAIYLLDDNRRSIESTCILNEYVLITITII